MREPPPIPSELARDGGVDCKSCETELAYLDKLKNKVKYFEISKRKMNFPQSCCHYPQLTLDE